MGSAASFTSAPQLGFIRSAGVEIDNAAICWPLSSRTAAATQRTPISYSSLSLAQPWRWLRSSSR